MVSRSALALLAVLPLIAAVWWSGFRLALQTDVALGAITPIEQPLSVRSLAGVWLLLLIGTWFGLVYRDRDARWWEYVLVVLGGGLGLVRLGNVWLAGLVLAPPLARQLRRVGLTLPLLSVGIAACVVLSSVLLVLNRPPELPTALDSLLAAPGQGRVFSDWRWSAEIQRRAGDRRVVLAAGGFTTAAPEYWLDYLRVSRAHERWGVILRTYGVDLVVLDASDTQRLGAEQVRAAADWRVVFDDGRVLVGQRVQQ